MNNKIRLDDIQISESTRILQNDGFIVIGNIARCGLWIKIPFNVYNFIIPYIGMQDGYKKLMDSLGSESEQDYYTTLLEKLAKIQVLEKKGKLPQKSLINNLCIELTTACNLKCKHCSGMYGSRTVVSLPNYQLEKIIKWASMQRINSITLTGGEIFCVPDIYEKLRYIRTNFHGKVGIITNATLLEAEKIHIIKECVNDISISLDGYDERSVDYIRGKNVFKKVIQSINLLKMEGISNISVSMVLTSDNNKHVTDFKNLCESLNVTPITRVFAVKGRAKENYDSLIFDQDKGMEDNILKHVNMLSLCLAGISTLSISANGSITLCPAIEDSNIVLGTVDELDNIEQILMKMKQTCIVEEVSPCNSCNVRYFCSSKCYATNINIFNNFSLREQRCKQYKKKLQKYVWE